MNVERERVIPAFLLPCLHHHEGNHIVLTQCSRSHWAVPPILGNSYTRLLKLLFFFPLGRRQKWGKRTEALLGLPTKKARRDIMDVVSPWICGSQWIFQLFLLPGKDRSTSWWSMVFYLFGGSGANSVGRWVCSIWIFSLVENTNASKTKPQFLNRISISEKLWVKNNQFHL